MNKPKSLTQMFRERVGLPPLIDGEEIQEYLTEREGMHIDSGMSVGKAIEEARKDLERLQRTNNVVKSYELDL